MVLYCKARVTSCIKIAKNSQIYFDSICVQNVAGELNMLVMARVSMVSCWNGGGGWHR